MKPIDYLKHIGVDTGKEICAMNEEPLVNLSAVTIEDCLELLKLGKYTLLNDGKVKDIVYPEYIEKMDV